MSGALILPGDPLSTAERPQDLGSALADSIELHLGADVPTALLLSAGVDSATIAAVSRRCGRDLDCVTVATEGSTDESSGAAETARHYGHHFQRIPASLKDNDPWKFFAAMQRPSIDGFNTYVVSHAVHEAGFKVALSGCPASAEMRQWAVTRTFACSHICLSCGLFTNCPAGRLARPQAHWPTWAWQVRTS